MVKGEDPDWKRVFTAAVIGDAMDLLETLIPVVGKPLGDIVDILYTLPTMRKELPEADKDIAYLAALAEVLPVIELLPNWTLASGMSYIKKEGLGEHIPSFTELLSKLPERGAGLKRGTARVGAARGKGKPLTEAERAIRHSTLFEELGLPTPGELLSLAKAKKAE